MPVGTFQTGWETGDAPEAGDYFTSGNGAREDDATDPYDGVNAYRFYKTEGASGISRLNKTVDWALDSEVWYGAAIRPPPGFHAGQTNQIRCFGWTDFNGSTQRVRSGLWVQAAGGSHDTWRVFRHVENTTDAINWPNQQTTLVNLGAEALPEGVWTMVEIHQILDQDDGEALTEVFLNGVSAGSSTTGNIAAPIATGNLTRMRYGLDDASFTAATSLSYDRAYYGTSQLGPVTTTVAGELAAATASARPR